MNNLYQSKFLKNEENSAEVEVIFANKEHEIFQAHFPENHLLPGFLQIDIIAEILKKKIVSIKKAKFLQPILPTDKIIFYTTKKENTIKVITKKEDKKYSEFSFVF